MALNTLCRFPAICTREITFLILCLFFCLQTPLVKRFLPKRECKNINKWTQERPKLRSIAFMRHQKTWFTMTKYKCTVALTDIKTKNCNSGTALERAAAELQSGLKPAWRFGASRVDLKIKVKMPRNGTIVNHNLLKVVPKEEQMKSKQLQNKRHIWNHRRT